MCFRWGNNRYGKEKKRRVYKMVGAGVETSCSLSDWTADTLVWIHVCFCWKGQYEEEDRSGGRGQRSAEVYQPRVAYLFPTLSLFYSICFVHFLKM